MPAFLVPHDPTPEPWRPRGGGAPAPGVPAFPGVATSVTAVPGGVRLTFAPAAGPPHVDALRAALSRLVARECGGVVRCALEVPPDGAAVLLTITGPPALRA